MASIKESIPVALPPWKLRGTIYCFMVYSTSKDATALSTDRSFLYSGLEEISTFGNGKFLGGLGMLQLIRYTESPVGPYDELLIVPGTFAYEKETIEGERVKVEKKRNLRITRIYVSQKATCWNGRTNWNIPKHLAKFTFTTLPKGGMSIIVKADEGGQSDATIFSATFQPISYLPSFPSSTNLFKYAGINLNLVQPPLPQGSSESGELAGTDRWCSIMPLEYTKRTSLGWWDLKQEGISEDTPLLDSVDGEVNEGTKPKYGNWWPGVGRWRIGMVMEDANIEFPEGRYWAGPNL